METFVQDLKYAVRMLVKNPGFTLVAVLSLTFGIGANTTIFTLAKALFTQTVPVREPERLIVVYSNAVMRNGPPLQFLPMSYLNARDIRDKNDVFPGSSIAIPTGHRPNNANLELGESTPQCHECIHSVSILRGERET